MGSFQQTLYWTVSPLLLVELHEIGLILADDLPEIAAFEARTRAERPWLFLSEAQFSHFDDIKDAKDE